MGHHYGDPAAGLDPAQSGRQGLFAIGVEIGIGLVEYNEKRIAIKGAGQSHPLPLAGRKRFATDAKPGFVAVGERHDHIMGAGSLRGRDDRLRIGSALQPGDVLGNRAGEEVRCLRHVADMAAARFGRPLVEARPVKAHFAAHKRPGAGNRPHERRLAGRARPDDAENGSGLQPEADIVDGDPLATARRADIDALDRQAAGRCRQGCARSFRREGGEGTVEALPCLLRRNQAAPIGNQLFDRSKRARDDDRSGNDGATAEAALDHQIGTERQGRRLHHLPDGLRQAGIEAGNVAGPALCLGGRIRRLAPALGRPSMHAERHQDLGIAACILAHRIAGGKLGRLFQRRRAGLPAGGKIEEQQHQKRARRQPADRRVQEETGHQIDRKPGQIEEGDRPGSCEKQPNLVEILRRLQDVAAEPHLQRRTGNDGKHPLGEPGIDDAGKARENTRPQNVEKAREGKEQKRKGAQRKQRRHALRGDHPVIDLQHEKRTGQAQ